MTYILESVPDQDGEKRPTNGRRFVLESVPGSGERPGMAEGLARSVGQGLTFGFGDEIEAGVRSLFGGESYREAVEDARREIEQFREDQPYWAYGSEIASSMVLPGGAAFKTMRYAPSALKAAGQGAVIAGTSGAVAGAGKANTNEEIVPNMVTGGTVGAATGAAAPFVGHLTLLSPSIQGTRFAYKGGKMLANALRKRYGKAADDVAASASRTGNNPTGFLARDFASDAAEREARQAAAKKARRDLGKRIRDAARATAASGAAQQTTGQQ